MSGRSHRHHLWLALAIVAVASLVALPRARATTNRADVSAKELDPNTGNNTALATTKVGPTTPQADLGLTVSDSPDTVVVEQKVTYSFVVRNSGPQTATGVKLKDPLPSGTAFVSAAPSGMTCTTPSVGGTVTCQVASLAVGATVKLTLVVRAPSKSGTLTNTATVSGTTVDPNTANDTATAVTTVTRR